MIDGRSRVRSWRLGLGIGLTLTVSVAVGGRASGLDCTAFLSLFQQGLSDKQIARQTGLTTNDVAACRRQLQQPIVVGPQGPPPVGAAGPAPRGAAGPPPVGAAGPPPVGAAGAPPVGREIKRLP
ncbi:MAG TPA: hypothetical protein VMW56_21410 [Candidatus Margulisiibacteriota bacterium]|nr:hypothetical protein [Candidatus Margulisiibacteriota bacterium]